MRTRNLWERLASRPVSAGLCVLFIWFMFYILKGNNTGSVETKSTTQRNLYQIPGRISERLGSFFFYTRRRWTDTREVARWQRDAAAGSAAQCDDVGLCTCPESQLFNGVGCIAASGWVEAYEELRQRWERIPLVSKHGKSGPLNAMSDAEYAQYWETYAQFSDYDTDYETVAYGNQFRWKNVLDVGSGFGRTTMIYAMMGANVTFLDLNMQNLSLLKKLCRHYGIMDRCNFVYLQDAETLPSQLAGRMFDVICVLGSLHHMPRELVRKEWDVYLRHLKIGGRLRWLAYPAERWRDVGFPSFERFCDTTDDGCPWAEWYDLAKLLRSLQPHKFVEMWSYIKTMNGDDRGEFSEADLIYMGK
eukprot:comp30244_c0_seq1/m.47234 comp30244_c0_seq1/g.47234  ORF comp30244_c0_seq1/g.47234 comp30244_c0_seq1/m.47234 type:complete len:361 (-) comp30244_c0_seq1:639-1721(-)